MLNLKSDSALVYENFSIYKVFSIPNQGQVANVLLCYKIISKNGLFLERDIYSGISKSDILKTHFSKKRIFVQSLKNVFYFYKKQ